MCLSISVMNILHRKKIVLDSLDSYQVDIYEIKIAQDKHRFKNVPASGIA